MSTNCSRCRHSTICRYIEDYRKFLEKVMSLRNIARAEGIDTSFFTLEVGCQFFNDNGYFNPFNPFPRGNDDLNKRTLNEFYDKINQNPCDNCPSKPDLSKGTYIGDSPCDWCQHNPNKITCK